MPCYFVSNGVEMSITNQTFDFIWNGFGNRELTDSETSSSEESYKANSSVNKNTNAEWRMSKHRQTQKRINNEKQKNEEEKLSKMTDEEENEYFKIQELQKIWKKVRPYFRS